MINKPNLEKLSKESINLIKKDTLIIIIEKLFQSRDITHLAHLKSNKYSEHVALNDYYNSILDFVDTLVETGQGIDEKLFNITIGSSTYQEPILHLQELQKFLLLSREQLKYEFQKNIIDEINSLISKTIYKLKFLK